MRARAGSGAGLRAGRCALVAAALALIASCGGNSPTAPRPGPPAPVVITFNPASSDPEASLIDLTLASSTATEFSLRLDAVDVEDLFGYALDLLYDTDIVSFDGYEAGTFFDEEGVAVALQVSEPEPGTVVIGQSRVGAVAGTSGTGTLLTLRFKAVAPGSFDLKIDHAGAFDSTGAELSIEFVGGRVTVPGTSS